MRLGLVLDYLLLSTVITGKCVMVCLRMYVVCLDDVCVCMEMDMENNVFTPVKPCSQCDKVLPLSDFHPNGKRCGRVRYRSSCKSCEKVRDRAKYVARQATGYQRQDAIKHGISGTRAYQQWYTIMSKCYKTYHKDYPANGGIGVSVCERWHDPAIFIKELELDTVPASVMRLDKTGDYEPGNVYTLPHSENPEIQPQEYLGEFPLDTVELFTELHELADSRYVSYEKAQEAVDKYGIGPVVTVFADRGIPDALFKKVYLEILADDGGV